MWTPFDCLSFVCPCLILSVAFRIYNKRKSVLFSFNFYWRSGSYRWSNIWVITGIRELANTTSSTAREFITVRDVRRPFIGRTRNSTPVVVGQHSSTVFLEPLKALWVFDFHHSLYVGLGSFGSSLYFALTYHFLKFFSAIYLSREFLHSLKKHWLIWYNTIDKWRKKVDN